MIRSRVLLLIVVGAQGFELDEKTNDYLDFCPSVTWPSESDKRCPGHYGSFRPKLDTKQFFTDLKSILFYLS